MLGFSLAFICVRPRIDFGFGFNFVIWGVLLSFDGSKAFSGEVWRSLNDESFKTGDVIVVGWLLSYFLAFSCAYQKKHRWRMNWFESLVAASFFIQFVKTQPAYCYWHLKIISTLTKDSLLIKLKSDEIVHPFCRISRKILLTHSLFK